MQLVRKTPK